MFELHLFYMKILVSDGNSVILLDYLAKSQTWVLVLYQTEYMVDMKCEGCVDAVKNKLRTVSGK